MGPRCDSGQVRHHRIMALTVEIDKNSGFCGGVIRAISGAERFLDEHPGQKLYSLGAIVHNEGELSRLQDKGLVCIDLQDLDDIQGSQASETLLIRAHGEPPRTYSRVDELGFHLIDCTCPVVLQLQGRIREAYERLKPLGGQLLIFGKIGHAEVLGLVGQVDGDAVIVEDMQMLRSLVEEGTVCLDVPTEIFSQTTRSPEEYAQICEALRLNMKDASLLQVHDTICAQVASRHSRLADFAMQHDVILFVSGRSSSNGKVLCDLCKSVNIRTYYIGGPSEVKAHWFRLDDKVGVCGATSTPKWLLEQVASAVENLAL